MPLLLLSVLIFLGESYADRAPVADFLGPALLNSAKLAAVAFILVVPLGILGGVVAALYQGRPTNRILSVVGRAATVVPEFVSGILLILLLASRCAGSRFRRPGTRARGS